MAHKITTDKIDAEIAHLTKKIDELDKEIVDGTVHDEADAYEDLSNWTGWRDALLWVKGGCKGNPHEGDGYE